MTEPEQVIKDGLDRTPEMMAALMKIFIQKKDVDSRVQIKMQMKALLDLASVDTTFPENALPDSKVASARDAAIHGAPVLGGVQFAGGPGPHGPEPLRRINNNDLVQ